MARLLAVAATRAWRESFLLATAFRVRGGSRGVRASHRSPARFMVAGAARRQEPRRFRSSRPTSPRLSLLTACLVARRPWRAFRSGASGQVDLISPHHFRPMTIAELNDAFRRSFTGGEVVVTSGIRALPTDAQAAVIGRVRSFEAFDAGNDPYG